MTSVIFGTVIGLAVLWQQAGAVRLAAPMAMTLAIFYFFVIVPQRKQQR